MCRMLAIAGQNFDPQLLKEFQALAITGKIRAGMEPGHNDGWGIAGFKSFNAAYFGRSADSAYDGTAFAKAVEETVKAGSSLLLAHLRKATGGEVNLHNTHPFIKNGWIFAHNGTIFESEKLPIGNAILEGTTDSERFFAFLVSKLGHCERSEAISEIATPRQVEARNDCYKEKIEKAIHYAKKNCDYTSLTFLLANKNFLIAYRDFNENSSEAAEYEKYYTLYHHKNADIICSEPLGNLEFIPLRNKELIIENPS